MFRGFQKAKPKPALQSRLNFATEEDLRQLQKLSTPLWIFDVERPGVWWANTQGLAFWKADSVEELRARDFSSDSATVQERLRQILELASADTHVTDTWTLYPRGTPQTVTLSFQPVEIQNQFKGILIELLHVLDRNEDDETWRLLEAARATSLIMTTFSLEGTLLAQNPASLACYGAPLPSKASPTDLEARFEDPAVADLVVERVLLNETVNWEAEVVTAKGVRTHSLSVRQGRDPITGNYVVVLSEEDVTERARRRIAQETEKAALEHEVAESYDKLKISQERYELAVQTADIWDWDVDKDKLFMSPNFVAALGYSADEFKDVLRTRQMMGLVHPDDVTDFQAEIDSSFERPGTLLTHEVRFMTKTGDAIWFQLQGKFIQNDAGKVTRAAGLLTNITQRKALEASLLSSQRMEAIGQLTGGIAHDFNNLLTVIQGNAELLQETVQSDAELTGEIIGAVRRGADLTKHLLAFARQQTLLPKPVDLNRLMPEMKRTLLRAISETLSIRFVAPDNLWPVHADQTQLETALLNLALNARDAMPSGGTLLIEAKNVLAEDIKQHAGLALTKERYVEIAVTDNGEGMTNDEVQKAFEPFFTTKGVGQGSGLGLSMVLGFSRQSSGDAWIESHVGLGTTVTFYLPKSEAVEAIEASIPEVEIAVGNQEHVHILEDNKHVQQAVSKTVQSLGYEVTISSNVDEALDWVKHNPEPHLYLLDILLPGGQSGVDFARTLRNMQPKSRILFMSGYSNYQLVEDSDLSVNTGFIAKPFDKGAFSKAIDASLKRDQAAMGETS